MPAWPSPRPLRATRTGTGSHNVDYFGKDGDIPDICEPGGPSYEAVVTAIGTSGIWIPTHDLSEAERAALRRPPPKMPDFSPENLLAKLPFTGSLEDLLAAKLASDPNNAFLQEAAKALADAQAMLANPEAVRGEESFGAMLLQRPSRRALEAQFGGLGINSCTALSDGSLVVDTDRGGSDAHEMIALALGEQLQEWASEHTDPRGVPVFRRSAIAVLVSVASYDDAVALLGPEVKFVKPHTIEDVIDQRKERFRAYLR